MCYKVRQCFSCKRILQTSEQANSSDFMSLPLELQNDYVKLTIDQYVLPPHIISYFNNALLQTALPFFKDSLQLIIEMFLYIDTYLWKKLSCLPKRKEKCEKLKQEFLDLYVRTKAKEENIKGKTKTKAQEPFYRIVMFTRGAEEIFSRLRYSRHRVPNEIRKNYEI